MTLPPHSKIMEMVMVADDDGTHVSCQRKSEREVSLAASLRDKHKSNHLTEIGMSGMTDFRKPTE
jgi:hypothetical protein